MTYQEALKYIHSLDRFGSRPGLDRVQKLFDAVPEALDQKFVHIAGTNGKGSVSSMLSYVLHEAGYKVGLFISPYIVDFRERIQINNEMITEEELAETVEYFQPIMHRLAAQDIVITEFEFLTVLGFYIFKKHHCDIVVCEVGMGGLLDSTNLIRKPLCSVITRIALDHTEILGDTIEKIAMQKCGIIKRGSCVATAAQDQAAMQVIRDTAEAMGDPLYYGESVTVHDMRLSLDGIRFRYQGADMQLPLIGEHQAENLRCALAAIEALREQHRLPITAGHIASGLLKTRHPARFEKLNDDPLVILDGAHNPNGLTAFANTVRTSADDSPKTLIIGMLSDKDIHGLTALRGLFARVIATNIANPRAMAAGILAEKLSEYFDGTDIEVVPEPRAAYQKALSYGDDIFICGSLYLASEIRPFIIG